MSKNNADGFAAKNKIHGELDRVLIAKTKIALLIKQGEHWALPLFVRLTEEAAQLEKQHNQLDQAIAFANHAALQRAA
ncbi:hypothetical protein K7H22_19900 [Seohaeicola saemankumensis]|uniref:hypothetical protein n=1 Tax=Seohaeicola saemankumensis TaxID=481181 RepID=UPI001E44672E|nr:hypothetical protein [Seohaeicola saemankumensis]MCD1628245.1 hypothetical protein [Seohaeicola saemankumensis]